MGEVYIQSGISEVGDGFVKQSIAHMSADNHSEAITAFLTSRGWKDF